MTSGKNKLENMHWSWRMAFTKSCSLSNEDYCLKLLKHSLLKDKALVVRAEAATRIGDRFEGTHNGDAIKLLSMAYKSEKNQRNGKPLFIQTKILDSILRIGGKVGLDEAKLLAQTYSETKKYWEKRSKI